MVEGAPKPEQERQPSPLTLMRFAHVVSELKKRYAPAERLPDSLIDREGAVTYEVEGERIKALSVFYVEKKPLVSMDDAAKNIQKIVASASVDENSTETSEKTRHFFLLSDGRIEEKIAYMKADGSSTPVIVSRDITDEQLDDFIDKKLKPFLE